MTTVRSDAVCSRWQTASYAAAACGQRRAAPRPTPSRGPPRRRIRGNPSTVTIVEGTWSRYSPWSPSAGAFSAVRHAQVVRAVRRSGVPTMSRNVCGSVALTGIGGFGVGKAIPNTAIRADVLEGQVDAVLRRCQLHRLLVDQRIGVAASQPGGGHRDAVGVAGRRTSRIARTGSRSPPAVRGRVATTARSSPSAPRRRPTMYFGALPGPRSADFGDHLGQPVRAALAAGQHGAAGHRPRRAGPDPRRCGRTARPPGSRRRSAPPAPAWRRARWACPRPWCCTPSGRRAPATRTLRQPPRLMTSGYRTQTDRRRSDAAAGRVEQTRSRASTSRCAVSRSAIRSSCASRRPGTSTSSATTNPPRPAAAPTRSAIRGGRRCCRASRASACRTPRRGGCRRPRASPSSALRATRPWWIS